MKIRPLACCVLLATTMTSPALAVSPAPAVGSAAPPLELTAADGRRHSLATGDGPKVLVFYRGLW
jgi:hypothetical protein